MSSYRGRLKEALTSIETIFEEALEREADVCADRFDEGRRVGLAELRAELVLIGRQGPAIEALDRIAGRSAS